MADLAIDAVRCRRLPGPLREEFLAWVRNEGMEPNVISDLVLGEGVVLSTEYLLNDDGKKFYDADSKEVAHHVVERPVRSMPPDGAFEVRRG